MYEVGRNVELKGAMELYNWAHHKPLIWFDNEHQLLYRDNAKVATNTMAIMLLNTKKKSLGNNQGALRNTYFGAPLKFNSL